MMPTQKAISVVWCQAVLGYASIALNATSTLNFEANTWLWDWNDRKNQLSKDLTKSDRKTGSGAT